jgi:hypothetical protein
MLEVPPSISINELSSLHADLRRVGMLLMAQNPRTGEYYHGREKKEIEEIIYRGGGIVRYPGNPPEYVIFRNGTRYTTTILPEWAKEDEILNFCPPPDTEYVVLNLLKETAKKFLMHHKKPMRSGKLKAL